MKYAFFDSRFENYSLTYGILDFNEDILCI